MAKTKTWLEAARKTYREALELARASPTAEAWAKLLAAGKALSSAEEPKSRGGRRSKRAGVPTLQDLEGTPQQESSQQEPSELERLE